MAKKQTYYVTIKGKKFDRGLIELADSSTSGKRDGRISVSDAKKLLNAVKDNNTYTDIEKKTMEYIRENYKFTDKADEWFRTEIRKWAAEKSSHSNKSAVSSEEYTTQDEAISLVVPHDSDLSEKNYSGYIPTPSAGKSKKNSAIPVLILSLVILVGFGVGIYYAFKRNVTESQSNEALKRPANSQKESEKKELSTKKEESSVSEKKKEDTDEGGIFGLFSKKYEIAVLSGKDEEIAKRVQQSDLIFAKNDITVHSDSRKVLDQLSSLLKRHPDLKAVLTGHASLEGTEPVNLRVSQLRAEMVRDYLLGNGIESNRLVLEAKGSSELGAEASNDGKNRRVNIRIVK